MQYISIVCFTAKHLIFLAQFLFCHFNLAFWIILLHFSDLKRDVTVVISSKGFYKTGIMSDVVQVRFLFYLFFIEKILNPLKLISGQSLRIIFHIYIILFSFFYQHAMLLPVLVCHLRFHQSLTHLENKLGYKFKDRFLLQVIYLILFNYIIKFKCFLKYKSL